MRGVSNIDLRGTHPSAGVSHTDAKADVERDLLVIASPEPDLDELVRPLGREPSTSIGIEGRAVALRVVDAHRTSLVRRANAAIKLSLVSVGISRSICGQTPSYGRLARFASDQGACRILEQ